MVKCCVPNCGQLFDVKGDQCERCSGYHDGIELLLAAAKCKCQGQKCLACQQKEATRAREEEARRAREEQARRAREEEARRAREEEARRAREEEARIAKQEASRAKEEATRAKEEARIAKQEASRAKEEATRAKEEARIAKQEASRAKEEATRAKEEARKAKEEEARRAREDGKVNEELMRRMAAMKGEKDKEMQEKDKEIERLKKENEELREQLKTERKQNFKKKTQEPGWEIGKASQEDIAYLFEEFEIEKLPKPLSIDRMKKLTVGLAVPRLKIDHFKASKLVFAIELMTNGIYSKEDKEKHLQNCSICKMEVKKGLEEYGVAANDSAAIAAKFAGMHFGEIKNLEPADCANMGIEASEDSVLDDLETALKTMKDIHSFA